MNSPVDARATTRTRARYNRLARTNDAREQMMETRFADWRRRLWSLVPAGRVLEVGIGTGKNLPYHPAGAEITGIDLSDQMLDRAREKARAQSRAIDLREMDAQQLSFPEARSKGGTG